MLPLIPIHELIHGLFYKLDGAPAVQYKANFKKFIFYAMADQYVTTFYSFVILAIAPFVIINTLLLIGIITTAGGLSFLFILPIAKTPLTKKQKINYAIKIMLCVIIWGLATEFIQKHFVVGRMFDVWDWAADTFGAICGWLVCKKWIIN